MKTVIITHEELINHGPQWKVTEAVLRERGIDTTKPWTTRIDPISKAYVIEQEDGPIVFKIADDNEVLDLNDLTDYDRETSVRFP